MKVAGKQHCASDDNEAIRGKIFSSGHTCSGLAPGLVLLLHLQPVVVPGHGEVHRDLQRLLAVGHLAHLPHREDEVEVHLGFLVIFKQDWWLLLVVGNW